MYYSCKSFYNKLEVIKKYHESENKETNLELKNKEVSARGYIEETIRCILNEIKKNKSVTLDGVCLKSESEVKKWFYSERFYERGSKYIKFERAFS